MLNKIFGSLINPITGLLEKAIPDRDKRNKLAHEIATMAEKQAHAIALAQIEVNKIEAQSPSVCLPFCFTTFLNFWANSLRNTDS